MPRHAKSAALVVALWAATGAASAAMLVGSAGNLTGLNGLVVSGTTYNVSFNTLSYDAAYATVPPAFLGNSTGATDAASALIAELNSASVTGILGQDCRTALQCLLFIPVGTTPNIFGSAAGYFGGGGSWRDGAYGIPMNQSMGCQAGFAQCNFYAQAVFTAVPQASVPEPATLGLVGLSLAGLALARKRRSRT